MNDYKPKYEIICYGETLWDVFPNGEFPGGAPMNVAVHLNNYKIRAAIASRIGSDAYGNRLLQFLKSKSVPTELIQQDNDYPTGIVKVDISDQRNASYDIVYPSAWDFIENGRELKSSVYQADCLVFGSLASRNTASKITLLELLNKSNFNVFDVNLRSHHYTKATIELFLSKSNIIKLNEDELKIIGAWMRYDKNPLEKICEILDREYDPDMIIVTLGSKGAMVYQKGTVFKQRSYEVKVKDTVGSGDAFLAAFLFQQIKKSTIEDSLAFACAAGSFVASQEGANPDYTEDDIENVKMNFKLSDK